MSASPGIHVHRSLGNWPSSCPSELLTSVWLCWSCPGQGTALAVTHLDSKPDMPALDTVHRWHGRVSAFHMAAPAQPAQRQTLECSFKVRWYASAQGRAARACMLLLIRDRAGDIRLWWLARCTCCLQIPTPTRMQGVHSALCMLVWHAYQAISESLSNCWLPVIQQPGNSDLSHSSLSPQNNSALKTACYDDKSWAEHKQCNSTSSCQVRLRRTTCTLTPTCSSLSALTTSCFPLLLCSETYKMQQNQSSLIH